MNHETAVFGGGCFWCTEAVFSELRGVISVTSGYAGGSTGSPQAAPTYEEVSTGQTGHAEVIKVDFDPGEISYHDLLTVFFATHDPTTLDRQDNDVGSEYRSLILYTNEKQKEAARNYIKKLNASLDRSVVTEVKPLDQFYEAEDYHKEFYKKNTEAPYCQVVIVPKLEKLQQEFADLLKSRSN